MDESSEDETYVVSEESRDDESTPTDTTITENVETKDGTDDEEESRPETAKTKSEEMAIPHEMPIIREEPIPTEENSRAFTTRDIEFRWAMSSPSPLTVEESVELPQFYIQSYWTNVCTRMYSTGEYPCVEAYIKLHRQTGYYLIQAFHLKKIALVQVIFRLGFIISYIDNNT